VRRGDRQSAARCERDRVIGVGKGTGGWVHRCRHSGATIVAGAQQEGAGERERDIALGGDIPTRDKAVEARGLDLIGRDHAAGCAGCLDQHRIEPFDRAAAGAGCSAMRVDRGRRHIAATERGQDTGVTPHGRRVELVGAGRDVERVGRARQVEGRSALGGDRHCRDSAERTEGSFLGNESIGVRGQARRREQVELAGLDEQAARAQRTTGDYPSSGDGGRCSRDQRGTWIADAGPGQVGDTPVGKENSLPRIEQAEGVNLAVRALQRDEISIREDQAPAPGFCDPEQIESVFVELAGCIRWAEN